MKKIRSYFILFLAAAFLSSCAGLNKMKKEAGDIRYDVTPQVLEAHGGLVNVTINGTFPEKYFNKKATLALTPVLTYAGGETAFDKVQVLQGEKVMANNKVITYTGGDFTYTSAIPYTDAMKRSELVLRTTATMGEKTLDFEPLKLADGVIATSTLVEKNVKTVIMPDQYVRIVPETKVADINYVINQANVRSSELKGEDVVALKEYIVTATADPNKELKGAVVSSYASPDGKFDENEKLSGKRGVSADKVLKNEFKTIEAAQNEGFFNSLTTAEDWEGFKTEVENSSIPDKELILRVLSMYSDPEVREREIKNMSAAFEALKTDVLPKLRRSKLIVNVDNIGRTDEQILAQMKSDPKVLSLEEMLHAGVLTTDKNEKLAFYKAVAEAYPKCIRAHNNQAATLLALGRADDAITALDKAKAIANNDVVKSNTGFAHILKGDMAKAEELFNSMTAATPESRYGLGIVAITKGEYDKAVNFFGTEASNNLALAQILKGDYNRAKSTIEGLTGESKTALTSYLKGIVGSHLDDKTYTLNALKEASSLSTDLSTALRNDLEFAKYFSDSSFAGMFQ